MAGPFENDDTPDFPEVITAEEAKAAYDRLIIAAEERADDRLREGRRRRLDASHPEAGGES